MLVALTTRNGSRRSETPTSSPPTVGPSTAPAEPAADRTPLAKAMKVINPVVARADELLAERDLPPLPIGVTAHKLRHTFASVLVMIGEDPAYVMSQLGHTDPAFTLRVYAHAMRRDEGAKERLKALVNGADWAGLGRTTPSRVTTGQSPPHPTTQRPRRCRAFARWSVTECRPPL